MRSTPRARRDGRPERGAASYDSTVRLASTAGELQSVPSGVDRQGVAVSNVSYDEVVKKVRHCVTTHTGRSSLRHQHP